MKIMGIRGQDWADFDSASSRKGLHMQHLMNNKFAINLFGSRDDAMYLRLFYSYAVCSLPVD